MFMVTCYSLSGKAKLTLSEQLISAWLVDYMSKHDEPYSGKVGVRAQIEGISADAKRLKELGFDTLVKLDTFSGTAKKLPLADLLERLSTTSG